MSHKSILFSLRLQNLKEFDSKQSVLVTNAGTVAQSVRFTCFIWAITDPIRMSIWG